MPEKTLIVVESPAKARTLAKILGKGYEVKASLGHVVDLPERKLGVDVEHDFAPEYVVKREKKKVAKELEAAAKRARRVFVATDPDREGEAIGYHVARLLKLDPNAPIRAEFHEITPRAVKAALKTPRTLDLNKVDAQQARRVLDRLVGYNLSPLLSEKFRKRALSAGRVQSVALRLVAEREAEIEAFKPEEYWTLEGRFLRGADAFNAELFAVDGQRVVEKRGGKPRFLITDEKTAQAVAERARVAKVYTVNKSEQKERQKKAPPPFTTSTLQQAASSRFGWSAGRTMRVAQRLYEGVDLGGETVGLITYMRTDSVRVAPEAVAEARPFIKETYGAAYLPPKPPAYRAKKGAQDAHEAIRPTSVLRTPEKVRPFLSAEEYKLYDLIWRRFVASQMTPARYLQTSAELNSQGLSFRATGSKLLFDGYLRVWGREEGDRDLPPLKAGEQAELKEVKAEQHFTQPPPRYTDASLVKALEEKGIGRPSTYAPTIETLEKRGYIEREGRALKPTPLGREVVGFLVEHFPRVLAYDFTAAMEKELDRVEEGVRPWPEAVRVFFAPFMEEFERVPRKTCPVCGRPLEVKVGRFGQFLGCTGYPECTYTEPLEEKREAEPIGEACPECAAPLVRKWGRYGPFIACSRYPECTYTRDEAPSTGIPCPKCQKGEIVAKKSRKGRTYWRCSEAECDFVVFDPPTEEKCPKCGWVMVKKGKAGTLKCSNPACPDYAYPRLLEKGKKATRKKKPAKKKKAAAASKKKATWAELAPFAETLPEVEARLAALVEGEQKSIEEAAKALGLEPEEAKKLHKRALFKLRMAYGRAKKAGVGA